MASPLNKCKYHGVKPENFWYDVEILGKQSDNWATHFLQDAASV